MLLHAERRAIVRFRRIGPYHIIALDAGALTVGLAELKDTGLRAELLLPVLRREDVLERVLIFATPDAGTAAVDGCCSVAPRRTTAGRRQFAGSPSGAGITTVATPSIGARFGAVDATAAGNVVAVAVRRRASRCGHHKIISCVSQPAHVPILCNRFLIDQDFFSLAPKRQNPRTNTILSLWLFF